MGMLQTTVPPDAKEAKNKGRNNSQFKQRERERERDGEIERGSYREREIAI
jgi:hypothetical protein